jgi:serine phosphatase RsbU (regulator of sigma subunit)
MAAVTLRKSTRIWLAVFATAAGVKILLDVLSVEQGCWGFGLGAAAVIAACVLLARATVVAFGAIVRKTTLRLAFSYFLIGVVPVPLLATLLLLSAYILAHQFMANLLRRETTAVGEAAVVAHPNLARVRASAAGLVEASDITWLKPGEKAPWVGTLTHPGFLAVGDDVWLAVPEKGARAARLLNLSDPSAPWMQELADRTGYAVSVDLEVATREEKGIRVDAKPGTHAPGLQADEFGKGVTRRPSGAEPPGTGAWRGEWVRAFYLETMANAVGERAGAGENVAILSARASPRRITNQLFEQGVAEIGKVFQLAYVAVGGLLLLVYLTALTIAFVLAGSIARNVNKLTRATQAAARGDFSVRIQSKSRDQIGDLARSFDSMAASMQTLLAETAAKQRLEAEVGVARTIQRKLLPAPDATLDGLEVHIHFEPADEIGGDYYDYMSAPGPSTVVALGDVAGHGLPTGLLVAMVKAALATLVETGHGGAELFSRLNDLIFRSTEPRHYMTLAMLTYDSRLRRGLLTNAGQLPPYRVQAGRVEALALPALPLGLFPGRTFPEKEFTFAEGDLLVFYTDGFIEAVNAQEESFGFERFEAVLRDHAAGGAAALRQALLAALADHVGGLPADDDRTLMILTLH